MNYRSIAKNASIAFAAQGIAFLLSVVQTLLIPKLLGTTQYGFWQLFVFYTSYVGFGHFGLNDGVYLIKGGQTRGEIDKKGINSQFAFGIGFQLIISIAIVMLAFSGGFGDDREFVIVSTGVLLTIRNAASFLMLLLQAMNETWKSSYATIVERLTFLVPLLYLIATHCTSYKPFIIFYIASGIIQLVFCLWHCRDFVRSGLNKPKDSITDSLGSIRVGFKLMIANIASMLILGIMRFAIDVNWGIGTFGELSLSLSLVNFFLAFISQASMVLFPALRQANDIELQTIYMRIRDAVSLFFPIVYLLYYPLVWLLSIWLPTYANSFTYFAFLIPLCIFDSKMNICSTTYFKVLRKEELLLRINLVTCFTSATITVLGTIAFESIYVVISGVVCAIIGRCIWSEKYLNRSISADALTGLALCEVVLTALFIATSILLPTILSVGIYAIAYLAYLSAYRKRVFELLHGLRSVTKR